MISTTSKRFIVCAMSCSVEMETAGVTGIARRSRVTILRGFLREMMTSASGQAVQLKHGATRVTRLKSVTWLRLALGPTNLILLLLGAALALLYRHGLKVQGVGPSGITWFIRLAVVQGVLYFAAAWVVWRARASGSTLVVVLVFGALFRLSILFAPPLLSDDVYRYVWDGRVQAGGINPYRYIPEDEAVSRFRDEAIYPDINRRDFAPTMYPPLAEAIYLLTTRISESVTWMKATMIVFEGVTMWALMSLLASFGLPRQRAL